MHWLEDSSVTHDTSTVLHEFDTALFKPLSGSLSEAAILPWQAVCVRAMCSSAILPSACVLAEASALDHADAVPKAILAICILPIAAAIPAAPSVIPTAVDRRLHQNWRACNRDKA